MIDSVAFRAPLSWVEPIQGGRIVCLRPDGSIDWDQPKRLMMEGSYGSTMAVRSVEVGFVEVAGSPAKWLQGHNLWGSDDLPSVVLAVMLRVSEQLGVVPSPEDHAAWVRGDVQLSRVDVNYMWDLGTLTDALEWVRAADQIANVKWRGRGHYQPGTLTFGHVSKGKRASDWQVVCYAKGAEISVPGHHLNPDLPRAREAWDWAQGKLRIEVRLRRGELRRNNMQVASAWHDETAQAIHQRYMSKIELKEEQMTHVDLEEGLKPRQRAALALWRSGVDCKSVFPRRSFYRIRKEISDAVGVDIASRNAVSNVVPLVRVLEAKPATLPDWASEITFCPPARLALVA